MRINTPDSAELIRLGNLSVAEIWDMDTDTLKALPVEKRFEHISAIKQGLYARFPAPENDPLQQIDNEQIPKQHLGVLKRLVNSLEFSRDYENFIIHVTQKAAEDLANRTQEVKKLLEWDTLEKSEKLRLVQDFHNTVIGTVRLELQKANANYSLTHLAKALPLKEFVQEPKLIDDEYETTTDGYASLSHEVWPGVQVLAINTHERSGFRSAIEVIETIAHESVHVIEGFLAHTFYHHAPFIPDNMISDAKMLFHMYDNDSYILGRLPDIYESQANEKMARKAGDTAVEIIAAAMTPS